MIFEADRRPEGMEKVAANVESTASPPTGPRFSLGQMLTAMCALGAAGGLLGRWFDVIAGAVFSNSVLLYGSVIVAAVASLFVLVQLACGEYRPVSACLYVLALGFELVGIPTGVSNGIFACFVVSTAVGCWVEIVFREFWHEHWSTAVAQTIAVACWGQLLTVII